VLMTARWVAWPITTPTQVGVVPIHSTARERAIFFKTLMTVDADGCPNAYAPAGSGLRTLDRLGNAGYRRNWWGLVTDTGEDDGEPVVQGPHDPFPGFYVAKTPFQDRTIKSRHDPRRYVDANRINYIALPYYHLRDHLEVTRRPSYGDISAIYYGGRLAYAIYADSKGKGSTHIGEGSIALARALGINSSPFSGGTSERNVLHVIFPGSGNGRPRTQGEIDNIGWLEFDRWGGLSRLLRYFPQTPTAQAAPARH
jgi:hypothetical protein